MSVTNPTLTSLTELVDRLPPKGPDAKTYLVDQQFRLHELIRVDGRETDIGMACDAVAGLVDHMIARGDFE